MEEKTPQCPTCHQTTEDHKNAENHIFSRDNCRDPFHTTLDDLNWVDARDGVTSMTFRMDPTVTKFGVIIRPKAGQDGTSNPWDVPATNTIAEFRGKQLLYNVSQKCVIAGC